MAKFSIVLPVRNGGEYIKACVNSILDQSVTDFNIEVLDNCSTDGTVDWLHSLNEPRIRIHISERPLSIEENWGRIVGIPKNEFMTFIGHDDLMDANFLEVMNELIDQYPDAGFYQAHFRYIDSNGKKIRSCKPMDKIQNAHEFLSFFLSDMAELSIGQIIRSAYYDEVGGIPAYPNLLYADFELWMRLLQKGFRAVANYECCSYRIHNNSTTNSSKELKYYYAFTRLLSYLRQLKQDAKDNAIVLEKYGQPFIARFAKTYATHLLRIPVALRKNITVSLFLKDCKDTMDLLIPGNNYDPLQDRSLALAAKIDSSKIGRELFLAFKKMYKKPFLKK